VLVVGVWRVYSYLVSDCLFYHVLFLLLVENQNWVRLSNWKLGGGVFTLVPAARSWTGRAMDCLRFASLHGHNCE